MKKFYGFFIVVLMMALLVITGCPADTPEETEEILADPINGDSTLNGNAEATADGFAALPDDAWTAEGNATPGKPVKVSVTVTNGYITTVTIDGPDESSGIGQLVIQAAPATIKAKNTFELSKIEDAKGVDVTAGATCTFNAIKKAGNEAVQKIIDDSK